MKRLLCVLALALPGLAQTFSEAVPDGNWWRAASAKERAAFIKGIRVGMAIDPGNLTQSESQLEKAIDSFFASAQQGSSITSAFQPMKRSPNQKTNSTAIELPDPPKLPEEQHVPLPPLVSQPESQNAASTRPFDSAPHLIHKVEPEYSNEARDARLEGTVLLYAEIGTDGRAANVRIVRGLGLGLNEKAIEAVREWEFASGMKDGKPIVVRATIEVNFRLSQNPKSTEESRAVAGAGPWLRIRSEHFEMYTNATESSARSILQHFELAHAIFEGLGASHDNSVSRPRIVAFASQSDFDPYQVKPFAAAYYEPGENCLVMGPATLTDPGPALHEYAHLMANAAGLINLPPWLTEGLAEVYSTLRPEPNGVLIGAAPRQRLKTSEWIPLADLLAAGPTSPYYGTKATNESATVLYEEGWALTHMLKFSPPYAPGYSEVLRLISSGASSQQALKTVYRRSIDAIEADLQSYLTRPLPTVLVPVRVDAASESITEVDALNAHQVKHVLDSLPKATWRGKQNTQASIRQISDAPLPDGERQRLLDKIEQQRQSDNFAALDTAQTGLWEFPHDPEFERLVKELKRETKGWHHVEP